MANIPFLNNAYFAAKVGIGAQNPLELLHLESTEPLIRLDDTNSGLHYIFGQDGDGFKFTTNNSTYGKYTFDANVGIGTTSPVTFLDVRGDDTALPATSGTTVSTGTRLRLASTAASTLSASLDIGIGTSSRAWIQSTSIGDLSDGNRLLLNPNGGNVGIGTDSPGYKLEVAGTARITSALTLGGNVNNRIEGTGSSLDFKSNGEYYFRKGANTNLTILSGGNVGIGTTSPVAKLDVLGTSGGPAVFDYTYATNAGVRIHGDESAMDIVGTDSGNHASTILLRNGNEGFGLLNNPNLNTLQFRSFTASADGFNIHNTGTNLSSLVDIVTLEKTGNVGSGRLVLHNYFTLIALPQILLELGCKIAKDIIQFVLTIFH